VALALQQHKGGDADRPAGYVSAGLAFPAASMAAASWSSACRLDNPTNERYGGGMTGGRMPPLCPSPPRLRDALALGEVHQRKPHGSGRTTPGSG
jgi:hypothetical protein